MQKDRQSITRRWLGRLSFSFLIIGLYLGWEGYQRYIALGGARIDWRTLLYFVAATLAIVLAFIGLRERYRPEDQ